MKILHIGQMIGGLDIYIRNTITYTNNSFEYIIVKGDKDNNRPVVKNGRSIKEYTASLRRELNPIYDLSALLKIIFIIIKEKPDLIHCHSAKGGFIGRMAGFITRRKVLYTPHAFSFLSAGNKTKRKFFTCLEKTARLNSYLLACSDSEKEMGINTVGYRHDKALVWANSVPMPVTEGNSEATKENKYKYICFIGRPCFQKNLMLMAEIANKVHKKHPEIGFMVLGVGHYSPDLEAVRQKIECLKLNDCIKLVPWVSHREAMRYVSNAMFYISTSRYEGLPLSVIEAMALGKCIVATDVPGNNDCVNNGVNGFLVQQDDVNMFSEKCIELIEDYKLRELLGHNSKLMFEEKFLIDSRIKELENIYNDLASF